jgi:chemotaxis protein histidine kinase CheA
MKKMILLSCVLAASVFAAPEAAPAAQQSAAPAEQAAPAAEAAAPAATEQAAPAAAPAAEAAAPAVEAAPAAAPAEQAAAPEAAASAEQATPAAEAAPAETAVADSAAAPAEEVAAAPADSAAAPADTAKAAAVAEDDTTGFVAAAAPTKEAKAPAKKKRKKKKMIDNAMFETQKLSFDVMADFELEAGKVFWNTEDDENGDNLETWNGEANFAILAEGDDFKGKLGISLHPGDLEKSVDDYETKRQKREKIRNDDYNEVSDYFELDEAWAYQETEHLNFKVGRWDNTDKNGDYFGGYIDGYLAGFMSTQRSENQLQFGFTPTENMDFFVSLISTAPHLNKGDVRAAFNFHGLEGLSDLNVQLAYRANVFDVVYDSDAEIKHNASLKANLPIIRKHMNIFAEAALMNIDPNEDMVIPVTGGFAFFTPVVDRIILEAEYIGDRHEHPEYQSFKTKNVKDVLGALYLEKAFTDRFSLSAGFHSYGSSRDFMLSGNLVGRIN